VPLDQKSKAVRIVSKADVIIIPHGTTEVPNQEVLGPEQEHKLNELFDLSKIDPFVVPLFVDDEYMASDVSWPNYIKYLTSESSVYISGTRMTNRRLIPLL
jgi:hypothetical protein